MRTFLILLFLSQVSQADGSRRVDKGDIEFLAIGRPSLLKIKGKGDGVSGQIQVSDNTVSGVLKFDLKTLKTGIKLRDEHTKEKYLQVQQYPEAILTLNTQELPVIGKEAKFRGELNLHGVQKNIEGLIKLKNNNEALGNFEILLSDFKIEIPNYLGVTVADSVKVSVNIKFE